MKFGAKKLQGIAATSSILLLLSAGGFAYAGIPQVLGNGHAPMASNANMTSSTSHTQTGQAGEAQEQANNSNNTTTSTTSGEQSQNGKNETSQVNQGGMNESHELKFALVSSGANFPGQGESTIDVHGLLMDVQVSLDKASPATQYALVLSLNGTKQTLGSLMTDGEGQGEIQAQFNATRPGTYQIGVSLLQGTTLALTSDPSTQSISLTQTTANAEGSQNQEGDAVNEVQLNQQQEREIMSAEDNKTIPAVVQVTGSGATASVLDSRFSVSVGKLEGNGIAIQISANNVTGSRVLVVNLSNSTDLASHSLVVTLDGNKITQASSITQILTSTGSDPARYIVAGTSTGLQLLVSIPHFSLHTIRLLPTGLPQTPGFFPTNGTILLASVIFMSGLIAAVYASRKRVHPLLA